MDMCGGFKFYVFLTIFMTGLILSIDSFPADGGNNIYRIMRNVLRNDTRSLIPGIAPVITGNDSTGPLILNMSVGLAQVIGLNERTQVNILLVL